MSPFSIDLDDFFGIKEEKLPSKEKQSTVPTTADDIKPFVLNELKIHNETTIPFTIDNDGCVHEFNLQKTLKGVVLQKMNKPLKNFTINISYYDLPEDVNTWLNTYINDLKYYL